MAGERRTKGGANDTSRRASLGGTVRSTTRRHGRQKAKVIPLPQGRRPRRSGAPPKQGKTQRLVGHGRLRLVVGVVTIVCLSLGARAAQLSVAEDQRYQSFTTQAYAAEQGTGGKSETGRGTIVSADGLRLATSLDAGKVIATPYQVEDSKTTAEALAGVLDSEAGDIDEIEEKLTEKNEDGAPGGYSVVAEGIEPEKAREVRKLGLPGISVMPDKVRVYPNGPLASQLVGYLGTDNAYGGIEARYDE